MTYRLSVFLGMLWTEYAINKSVLQGVVNSNLVRHGCTFWIKHVKTHIKCVYILERSIRSVEIAIYISRTAPLRTIMFHLFCNIPKLPVFFETEKERISKRYTPRDFKHVKWMNNITAILFTGEPIRSHLSSRMVIFKNVTPGECKWNLP